MWIYIITLYNILKVATIESKEIFHYFKMLKKMWWDFKLLLIREYIPGILIKIILINNCWYYFEKNNIIKHITNDINLWESLNNKINIGSNINF